MVRFRDSSATPDGVLDETLYYTHDAQFNVTALVTPAGTVVERYAYDPYGQPIFYDGSWGSRSTSSYGNAILFAGYYFDAETGFYHVRNRMYHAQLGRWLQRDPLGYVDGMSLYEYCGGNAILGLDPMGLGVGEHVEAFFGGIVDGVIGIGEGFVSIGEGVYDVGALTYGLAYYGVTGESADVSTFSSVGDKPAFAQEAERIYEGTGSYGLATVAAVSEGLKALPGGKGGAAVGDAMTNGEWTTEHTKAMGETAAQVAAAEAVRRYGNTRLGGKPKVAPGKGAVPVEPAETAAKNGKSPAKAVAKNAGNAATEKPPCPEEVGNPASTSGHSKVTVSSAEAKAMAKAWKQGQPTRPIVDRATGKVVGEITADGNRVIRYPHTDSGTPQPHWNLEDKSTGTNTHVVEK